MPKRSVRGLKTGLREFGFEEGRDLLRRGAATAAAAASRRAPQPGLLPERALQPTCLSVMGTFRSRSLAGRGTVGKSSAEHRGTDGIHSADLSVTLEKVRRAFPRLSRRRGADLASMQPAEKELAMKKIIGLALVGILS